MVLRHVGRVGLLLLTLFSFASAQTQLRLGYQRGDFSTVLIEQRLIGADSYMRLLNFSNQQANYSRLTTVGYSDKPRRRHDPIRYVFSG